MVPILNQRLFFFVCCHKSNEWKWLNLGQDNCESNNNNNIHNNKCFLFLLGKDVTSNHTLVLY